MSLNLVDWCRQNDNENLLKQWGFDKNIIEPSEASYGSNKKAWWVCEKGHSWQAVISSRTRQGNGCPYCVNQKILAGYNDLATLRPELIKEWDYSKNTISPNSVPVGTKKSVWWKCSKCGNEWKAAIVNRAKTKNPSICPICGRKKSDYGRHLNALNKNGSFAEKHPELFKYWHPKNPLKPQEYAEHSKQKVWWICDYGHEYQQKIAYKSRGNGCPICDASRQTSFPEQAIYYYVKKAYPDAISRYKDIFDNGMELDIFIPSIKVAIEYDGFVWHDEKAKNDTIKEQICMKNGIYLYRILEPKLERSAGAMCLIRDDDYTNKSLEKVIGRLAKYIGFEADPDILRDKKEIDALYGHSILKNSLAIKRPDLIELWDAEKNGSLNPDHVVPGSHMKVWWKCKKGHSYLREIREQTNSSLCPFCRNLKGTIIQNIELGQTFAGVKEAAESLGLHKRANRAYISDACKNGWKAYGYHWKRVPLSEIQN